MSSNARVLMIGTDLRAKGGISSVLSMYADAGLFGQVRFMASYTDGGLPVKVGHYLWFLLGYIHALLTCPDIRLVHVHTASYGSFMRKSVVMLLAKMLGRKLIVHVHGAEFALFYQKSNPLAQGVISRLLGSADVVIALSQRWKEDLRRISGRDNVRVVYNPTVMHPPVSGNGKGDAATRLESVRFLFMGRLGKRKGVYDIIESARQIREESVEIHLYGDGEIEAVQTAVSRHAVEDRVKICGWIDGRRKDATFRSADVLILPSYNEGLPISVLEALAYGIPVVATDVGGIPEAVEDGVNGYLIKPGDAETLAARIRALALSPDLRKRMGRRGYQLAERKFALPVIIEQLEALYDELVD